MTKKVIASLTQGPDYHLADNAGRAPYFVVFQNELYLETIKNPFTSGGGAGIAVAELLKDIGCTVFVAGKVGDKMADKLTEYNIQF